MAVTTPFATIEEAIEEIREGRFVVVVDDPDRENEGDLVIAAQFATPEALNFMMTHARGQICLCLTESRADELGLRLIADQRRSRHGTAYTATIDARDGIATGVSAADRSHTVQVAISPDSGPSDLLMGGHVQGHVDGVGVVRSVEEEGQGRRVWFDAGGDILKYTVEKGSIAVQGASLTVADLDEKGFAVALIPHTLEVTTLSELEPGSRVNLEVDVLAKYVEKLLRRR